MAEVRFAQVSPYAILGGKVEGVLELELDRKTRVKDVTVTLVGQEHAHLKESNQNEVTSRSVFLEQAVSLKSQLPFVDPGTVPAGAYQLRFQFDVPADGFPTIMTGIENSDYGFWDSHDAGLFVDYELDAKVEIPLWPDPKVRHRFWVLPPVRILGALPVSTSPPSSGRVGITLAPSDPANPWVVPGNPFELMYVLANPRGLRIAELTVSLVRVVDYTVQGTGMTKKQSLASASIPVEGNSPQFKGTARFQVPTDLEAVNPCEGKLFICKWIFEAVTHVHWGLGGTSSFPLSPPGDPQPGGNPQGYQVVLNNLPPPPPLAIHEEDPPPPPGRTGPA